MIYQLYTVCAQILGGEWHVHDMCEIQDIRLPDDFDDFDLISELIDIGYMKYIHFNTTYIQHVHGGMCIYQISDNRPIYEVRFMEAALFMGV